MELGQQYPAGTGDLAAARPGNYNVDQYYNIQDHGQQELQSDNEREEGQPPETIRALILSILSFILCMPACAMMDIIITWQARLQVLDKKYTHARHSLQIVWVFLCAGLVFGLAFWGIIIWLIAMAINR